MSKMAGTKRTHDNTEAKASKKAKVASELPKQAKSASLEDDFVPFDDADNGTALAVSDGKAKKQKEKYRPQVYKAPKKPEPYLNGAFMPLLCCWIAPLGPPSLICPSLQGPLHLEKRTQSRRRLLKTENPQSLMQTRSHGRRKSGSGSAASLMCRRKNETNWSKNYSR